MQTAVKENAVKENVVKENAVEKSVVKKVSLGILLVSARLLRFFAHSLLVFFALLTLGCFVPSIPALGSIGPLLVSPYGPWITLLALAGAVMVLRRWRRTNKRRTLLLAVLATFAALGTLFIQVQQFRAASSNGVAIDLPRTLWLGQEEFSSAAPELQTYSSYDGQDLPLAIYRPVTPPAQSLAPIIVYVHGGGWGGGTLYDRAADMHWFANHGFLVISVEYTLATVDRHTWDLAPAQVGCALGWIASNAARYGGDASRLALFGESAGGNLVLNVAYLASAGALQPSCDAQLPPIAATIAGYPIVDALRMYANDDIIAGRFARMMTTRYTGGTPEQFPGRYAAVSPFTHIHPAAPPTLLLPGLADHLLPPQPVYGFAEKAQAAGVEARVIAFPYGEHSYDQRAGSIGSQLFRGATLQFLGQHGLVGHAEN